MGVGERLGKALLRPFVDRFVAGPTTDDALVAVRELNEDGVGGIVASLGEHVHDPEVAREGVVAYRRLIDALAAGDLDGCISVKPTHMGLEIGEDLARDNLLELTEHAQDEGVFVWVDMERSTFTEATIRLYEAMLDVYDEVGLCLQTNLRRTPKDVERVVEQGGVVRLVKGAYDEPATIAHPDKQATTEAYAEIMADLFERGARFAVATHDMDLIRQARRLDREHDADWEFQTLLGVREDLPRRLAADGYRVQTYIPYGTEWFGYYWRRIQERRENLWFAVKAVLGR